MTKIRFRGGEFDQRELCINGTVGGYMRVATHGVDSPPVEYYKTSDVKDGYTIYEVANG